MRIKMSELQEVAAIVPNGCEVTICFDEGLLSVEVKNRQFQTLFVPIFDCANVCVKVVHTTEVLVDDLTNISTYNLRSWQTLINDVCEFLMTGQVPSQDIPF